MPGTFASAAAAFIFFFFPKSNQAQTIALAATLCAGLLVCGRAERALKRGRDPGCIVIDEVAGMFLALSFLPHDLRLYVLGFLVFRTLDIIKPYPADKFQAINGSIGIMSDDIVAGVYANIILQAVLRLAVFNAS